MSNPFIQTSRWSSNQKMEFNLQEIEEILAAVEKFENEGLRKKLHAVFNSLQADGMNSKNLLEKKLEQLERG